MDHLGFLQEPGRMHSISFESNSNSWFCILNDHCLQGNQQTIAPLCSLSLCVVLKITIPYFCQNSFNSFPPGVSGMRMKVLGKWSEILYNKCIVTSMNSELPLLVPLRYNGVYGWGNSFKECLKIWSLQDTCEVPTI